MARRSEVLGPGEGFVVEDHWRSMMLAPEASSASRARRFVTECLEQVDGQEHVDVAQLLTSELVTNALLHGGSNIECRCLAVPGGVRVEVVDGSQAVPTARALDDESDTGRGLAMVEAVSTAWGADVLAHGKRVWFELGDLGDAARGEDAARDEPVAARAPAMATVALLGAPVQLVLATIQYGDALLRETALWAVDHASAAEPADAAIDMFDLGPIVNAAHAAREKGLAEADLVARIPAGNRAGIVHRLGRVGRLDQLARAGRLLTAPALPEVGTCRVWIFTELLIQLDGGAPSAWVLPEPGATGRHEVAGLSPDDVEELDRSHLAIVIADESNRIAYVSAPVEELLGWAPDELVGRRLLTIIPPSLRADHLAGFTRYALTGESKVLDQDIVVPALHHDGSEVTITLRIEATKVDGVTHFHATLTRARPPA